MSKITEKTIFKNYSDNPLEAVSTMNGYFAGSDPSIVSELGPFTQGYLFAYWIELPAWFDKDEDLKNFKSFTQKSLIAFNGITDTEFQEATQTYGFAGNGVSFATGSNKGNEDFTLTMHEYSGTPVTNLIDKWRNYIFDEQAGIPIYPKEFDVEFAPRNHTATLAIIFMRPDVNNVGHANIEKGFIWRNVYPLNTPLSGLFSYEQNSNDAPQSVDVNFKGFMLRGPAVDDYCRKILSDKILNISANNNDAQIFINTYTKPGDEGTELFTNGIMKDIYNNEE